MGKEARHARPDKIDYVRRENPELHGVPIEQVHLQRRPDQANDDEPHNHLRVAVLQDVQDIVFYRTPLD